MPLAAMNYLMCRELRISWSNDCDLKVRCGNVNIHHAGFVSPYNTGGGWKWVTVNGITYPAWINDDDNVYHGPIPNSPWYCMIRCKVTYNGQTYWFSKEVIISGA
jgi:hypothetical protein